MKTKDDSRSNGESRKEVVRNKSAKTKALVIVAHPDDETIWMGGFILLHPNIDWTILSLCRASDPDRAPKFKKIAKALGARGIITDLDDEGKITEKQALPKIKAIIKEQFGGKKYTYLFTHGPNGEYGHPRHITTHLAIKKLLKAKVINIEYAFNFNYKKLSKYKLTAKADSDFTLKLTKAEFKHKFELMTKIYGFDPKGIDANLCTNPEAFKLFATQTRTTNAGHPNRPPANNS